jgi:hypothetical protein
MYKNFIFDDASWTHLMDGEGISRNTPILHSLRDLPSPSAEDGA